MICVSPTQESRGGNVVLSMHHLQGVFILLLLGFSGALLVLLGEVLVKACGARNKMLHTNVVQ